MNDFASLAARLQKALGLDKPAIAVCLTDTVPEGVADVGDRVPAGCTFWKLAETRTFATSPKDHAMCSIGVYTHNLGKPTDDFDTELGDALGAMGQLEYVREADMASIPALERSPSRVIYGPLAEAPQTPDVVLVFVDAAQGLLVAEAAQQVELGHAPALGRPACSVVAQTANTGRAALSLGCCGARAYVDTLDARTLLWALPGAGLGAYIERLERLSAANEVLFKFHHQRRQDVADGASPSVKDSLGRI